MFEPSSCSRGDFWDFLFVLVPKHPAKWQEFFFLKWQIPVRRLGMEKEEKVSKTSMISFSACSWNPAQIYKDLSRC